MTDFTELPEGEAEADAPECSWHCEQCEDCYSDDDTQYTVVVGRRSRIMGESYSPRYVTECWCESCLHDSACEIEGGPSISDGWVSRGFAEDSYYYHDCDGVWRDYPEESDYEDDSEGDSDLLSYGTDVINVLGWPRESVATELLFGVELEMEARNGHTANDLVYILGGSRGTRRSCAIIKSDGSLADGRGAELVTLPYTLEHHRKSGLWSDLLDSRLQAAAMSGAGTTNCGIHVHISRAALSPLTIGKMVVFLNNPDNSAFVTLVAQRRSGGYCQRDEKKKITSALPQHRHYASRYDIINVTGGPTVEVRMFRGNLRPERVLKNIEFCHALVRYCEATSITESQRWGGFCNWVAKQRKAYPNLAAFLTENSYLPPRRDPAPAVVDL